MSSQSALFLESKHSEFTVRSTPVPKPGSGEVLVQVKAAALNPVDWKIQKYDVFVKGYPAIVGTDVAGDVAEVGEGVTEFSKGDRVFFQGSFINDYAGFQQYALAATNTLAKIPAKFSYDEVSTIPVALTAAYVGLYNAAPYGIGFEPPLSPSTRGKYANTPLVILGGSSSVGQFAIQLAKASGFNPIITTSSLKHAEFVKSLGATDVIDRHIPLSSLPAEVQKITQTPITAVYDAISLEDTQKAGLDLLVPGGQLAVVLQPLHESEDKKVAWVIGVKTLPHNVKLMEDFWAKVPELLEEGVIKPNRLEVISGGLNGIVEGLVRLEKDQVSGAKLVVHPHETS